MWGECSPSPANKHFPLYVQGKQLYINIATKWIKAYGPQREKKRLQSTIFNYPQKQVIQLSKRPKWTREGKTCREMLSKQEGWGGTGQRGTDQPCSPAWWRNRWASRRDPVQSWHLERGRTGINHVLQASCPESIRTDPFSALLDTLSIPGSSVSQAQVNSRAHPCTEEASCREFWCILEITAPTARPCLAA